MWGEKAINLGFEADRIAKKYNVTIIYTPQYTDIWPIAEKVERVAVFAQHMDFLEPGTGIGSVLPEAVKAAGAKGVLLNHVEKKLKLEDLKKTIKRADEVGLATIVCADDINEAVAVAELEPNIIIAEPPSLIGIQAGNVCGRSYVKEINASVQEINPDIHVLHGAGIYSGKDVYDMIMLGAEATGCTSGVMKAENPVAALEDMISSLRKAWDELYKTS